MQGGARDPNALGGVAVKKALHHLLRKVAAARPAAQSPTAASRAAPESPARTAVDGGRSEAPPGWFLSAMDLPDGTDVFENPDTTQPGLFNPAPQHYYPPADK